MAIINTLKLARALTDKGGFSVAAAEATAEAFNSALNDDVATKSDVKLLDGTLKALDGKLTLIVWAVGINAAATIAMLIKHW